MVGAVEASAQRARSAAAPPNHETAEREGKRRRRSSLCANGHHRERRTLCLLAFDYYCCSDALGATAKPPNAGQATFLREGYTRRSWWRVRHVPIPPRLNPPSSGAWSSRVRTIAPSQKSVSSATGASLNTGALLPSPRLLLLDYRGDTRPPSAVNVVRARRENTANELKPSSLTPTSPIKCKR